MLQSKPFALNGCIGLTDFAIRQTKATGHPYTHGDSDGLAGGTTAVLASLIVSRRAFAKSSYPDKPIRLVSPFEAGGATDIPGRLLAHKMFDGKASIFIDNIAGADATIGSAYVANAPPDGYTLLISNLASRGIAPSLYPHLPYDAQKRFAHICRIGSQPNVLVVKTPSPYPNLQALIAACKAAPGKLTFGSAGIGSSPHQCGVLLQVRTRTKALHVPYKGTPPALVPLLSGTSILCSRTSRLCCRRSRSAP